MKLPFIMMTAILTLTSYGQARSLSFPAVWDQIAGNSPAQKAAQLKAESAKAGADRTAHHWLPRLYLDARGYSTNDPGSSFFGLLEQRQLQSSDFNPDSLNHPDARNYVRGALGLDLPLYEGGMKTAQSSMQKHVSAAEEMGASQIRVEQYAQTGVAYAAIASIRRQKAKLIELRDELSRLTKGYQLGQKSNPVGYSGLLGMKSLANRVAGVVDQLQAQEKAYYAALKEMGVEESDWAPEELGVRTFVDKYFNAASSGESFQISASAEMAKAAQEGSRMERARYLPRVGAFAESYVFNGSRDTANGYTAGLYLQWSLFDPADYGKYNESKLSALAAQRMSEAAVQQEKAERAGVFEAAAALKTNLERLEDSEKLLSEQTRVSANLFRNGSINALQFVEILNRRTDLVVQTSEAELGYLKASSTIATKSKFDLPENMRTGGGK